MTRFGFTRGIAPDDKTLFGEVSIGLVLQVPRGNKALTVFVGLVQLVERLDLELLELDQSRVFVVERVLPRVKVFLEIDRKVRKRLLASVAPQPGMLQKLFGRWPELRILGETLFQKILAVA